jgi:hypothetical protein
MGYSIPYHERQAFHHPHTSMGGAGHWLKTAGILAPLVIGEFVKDAEQRWRCIRLSSVAKALISEAIYAARVNRDRHERQTEREQCWQDRIEHRRAAGGGATELLK